MLEVQHDRLIPSLLDRLTDDQAGNQSELSNQRAMSSGQLKASVLRDLAWLFNASRFDDEAQAKLPMAVRCSVLNYGLPPLSGRFISGVNLQSLEREFRQAIINFEPRLIAQSVSVKAQVDKQKGVLYNIVSFNIRALLWAQPAPIELSLITDLDLETGQCRVSELSRR